MAHMGRSCVLDHHLHGSCVLDLVLHGSAVALYVPFESVLIHHLMVRGGGVRGDILIAIRLQSVALKTLAHLA